MFCSRCLDSVLANVRRFFTPQEYLQVDVLLLGLKNAGKTSFVQAILHRRLDPDTVPTLSMKVCSAPLEVVRKQPARQNMVQYGHPQTEETPLLPDKMVLKMYDLSGQHRNQYLWKRQLELQGDRLNSIVYLVDISDGLELGASLAQLKRLLLYDSETLHIPFVIVFNKLDLVDDLDRWLRLQGAVPGRRGSVSSYLRSSRERGGLHYKRARLLLDGKGYHRVLMDYVGVFSKGGRLYLTTEEGDKELQLDLGLFALSLKDPKGEGLTDSVSDVVEWIRGGGGPTIGGLSEHDEYLIAERSEVMKYVRSDAKRRDSMRADGV